MVGTYTQRDTHTKGYTRGGNIHMEKHTHGGEIHTEENSRE